MASAANHEQDACKLNNARSGPRVYLITPKDRTLLSNSKQGGKMYLRWQVPVISSHESKLLHTYAILDDG
ncbi:hypothetical protein NHX12_029037 [Muraenolepis orangiensis]|uniref:Uncharacterized protein n=1 Tax=Muraenolepis orangiensis TaxID=630683 RepID=A0A9Q0ECI9_9TELE|nr:hypothetical protein NHX12_029037 [Muraenolepis orangiensis]